MLDIVLFREDQGGNPNLVRESQRRRFKDVKVVDTVIELDTKWRAARHNGDVLNRMVNVISKTVGEKKKAKEAEGTETNVPDEIKAKLTELTMDLLRPLTVSQLKEVRKLVDEAMAQNSEELVKTENERDSILKEIGNLVPDDVPVSDNEDNNAIVRTFGEETKKKYSHVDLISMIGGVDSKRGAVTSGARGYYLMGPGVFLERAVVELSLSFLNKKGYTPLVTPFFMRKEVMQEVAQLSQFDEELYKVLGKGDVPGSDLVDEKYLIATSEQPIAAFHRDEWIPVDQLPIKYSGLSYCFRQEVGSHGRDTRGIFRVHQFQKVSELWVLCFYVQITDWRGHDGASWAMMEEMISNAEDFCKALGLPYRVVNIVSGELNNAAAKKLDLEAYFPGSGAYRELVSCSNCLDYQSRRLKVRYGATKKMNTAVEYVHMLNATMCATTRVKTRNNLLMSTKHIFPCSDNEIHNYLSKSTGYKEFIPFKYPAPIDEEAAKKKKKGGKNKQEE
ncbi:probable serine--tRNA ligase, cytoplasmic [Penaeus japonicus]|uniref:probable serine--tRNA ligase, cytoplasmic n=1 Tax=Penaeus japonicus TaxID=27405 RepID=UPI001C710FF7|nr:probable serine--tRNA ligase, cytoplasmic [Penaeus japonicus]